MRFASTRGVVELRLVQFFWPLLGFLAMGCLVTDTIEFIPDENFPPSIISAPGAQHPLNEIGAQDLDEDPLPDPPEYVLETLIRDVNVDQVLEYRLFKDADEFTPSFQSGEIPPSLNFERSFDAQIPFSQLELAGVCHRFELLVSGKFKNFSQPREPLEEGDIDAATWWVRVTSDAIPTITQECQ